MLRYRKDLRTLITLVMIMAVQFYVFCKLSPLAVLFCLPLLILGTTMINSIHHNQMHLGIFRSRLPNSVLNFILTLGMGSSAGQMAVTHKLIHHREMRTDKDWTRYSIAEGKGFRRLLSYLRNAIRNISAQRSKFIRKLKLKRIGKRILAEKCLLGVFSICLILWNPLNFILCYVIPWLGGLIFVLIVNLAQHDELNLSEKNHSRNFVGTLPNFLSFNAFYHSAHHNHPKMHWSLLVVDHQKNNFPSDKSFFLFLWKHYFYPATKVYSEQAGRS